MMQTKRSSGKGLGLRGWTSWTRFPEVSMMMASSTRRCTKRVLFCCDSDDISRIVITEAGALF